MFLRSISEKTNLDPFFKKGDAEVGKEKEETITSSPDIRFNNCEHISRAAEPELVRSTLREL